LKTVRYCGRDFTLEQIETIRAIIAQEPTRTRAHLSRIICKTFDWYKPDGGLKDMSCRVAMLRMHADGLIRLPPPRHRSSGGRCRIRITETTDPKPRIKLQKGRLPDIDLRIVTQKHSTLWNEYIHRYHYLGYKPLPGAQLRYMVLANGQILALLGFSAAAWRTAPRDEFIGWNDQQRQRYLYLVVNNSRFLILPWVCMKNLASRILAAASKRLSRDWQIRYGYRPVLLETFVETGRFRGTSYKAANWIFVGQTKGRGKLGDHHNQGPKKDIWIYPLATDFSNKLKGRDS